jgi:dTDP-4-dehydrorhamnose 3,5-epimerase
VRWTDPDIAVAWPVDPETAVLSEKDRTLPFLADMPPPFEP